MRQNLNIFRLEKRGYRPYDCSTKSNVFYVVDKQANVVSCSHYSFHKLISKIVLQFSKIILSLQWIG